MAYQSLCSPTPLPLELDVKLVKAEVHSALRAWQKVQTDKTDSLPAFLNVRQLAHKTNHRFAVNQVLLDGLTELAIENPVSEQIIRRRFLDGQIARQVASELVIPIDELYRQQRQAIHQLTQQLIAQEKVARLKEQQTQEAGLQPASYNQLFGFQKVQQSIVKTILNSSDAGMLLIAGIGGIGKTALADSVIRQLITTFAYDKILWVRIEQSSLEPDSALCQSQLLTQLEQKLNLPTFPKLVSRLTNLCQIFKEKPHLVVVDNIENREELSLLIETIAPWCCPSYFLLTSRIHPLPHQALTIKPLGELPPVDALALIRYEAKRQNLSEVTNANSETLQPILDVVGGNPYALKLVVGLANMMPIPTILSQLKKGVVNTPADVFQHIYWQAWQTLSSPAQSLLLAMPLSGIAGNTPEQLQAYTQLSEGEFWQAVQELRTLCLLEVRGNAWERRYGIHRLTESFLQSEIIGVQLA